MAEYNIDQTLKNEFYDNSQEAPLQVMYDNLKSKASLNLSSMNDRFLPSDDFNSIGLQEVAQKASFSKQIPIQEGYDLVGDTWMSKYPTYKEGRNNAEFAAQNQDTWDKWANGLTKAGANLLSTIVGNTVGIVYGAANGMKEGSFNAVFDNNFSNALADWNEKLGYQLPNYVSKQEQEEGFLGSLNNANFWANDVAGGVSFTLGTVVSEAIWGVATAGIGNSAKWGLKGAQVANKLKYGKLLLGADEAVVGLANWKKIINSGTQKLFTTPLATKTAGLYSNTAKWLNTGRFLATTSGNEAGIEALHYKRESRENFYENFAKQNGREPSAQEIAEFEDNLANSANAVFATNMAILAPSNMAMFGNLFNIASPLKGLSKVTDKTLFGIGVEKTAEGVYKGIEASTKQKIGRIAYAGLKPLVSEGLWEEGLQGVTSKSAENWIESTYNPKYNNETLSLSEATYEAFAEQYGTKAGWKEIGIGGIIGAGASAIIGKGKFEELREFDEKQKYQDEYIAKGLNQFGDNSTVATDLIAKKIMLNARIKSASEKQIQAIKQGDDVGAMLAQQEPLIAEIQFRKSIGENPKELISKYETALNALPQEAWDEAGITNIQEYKESVINGYKNLINAHEKASNFADAVFGDTKITGQNAPTQQLKDALTYSIISGQTANRAMDTILKDMSNIIGQDSVKAKAIQMDLQRLGKNKQAQVRNINNLVIQADREVKTLSEELQRLQVSKDETKGERLQKVQSRLVEANDKLLKLTNEREDLAQEVSQESRRRKQLENIGIEDTSLNTDFITGEDLATIENKLEKINATIKDYEGVNHEVYYELLDLQKQYNSAKEKFLNYQYSIDSIVSGKFQPKFARVNGLLGKVFNDKEPINNFTNEYLKDIYENYQKSLGNAVVDESTEAQFISDEDFSIFKETGVVSEDIKIQISNRVKNKEVLTAREKEIYDIFTNEINNLTQTVVNPNKPDLTPIEKIEVLTEAEKLRRDLSNAMQKDYPLITTDVDELIKEKPTEKEVERYSQLYKKRSLDKFEQEEFAELQPRMQKWFMAQSLPSLEGMSVADVVELIEQLETQIDKEQTITEITAEDILGSAEENDSRAQNRSDILQNFAGNVVTKIKDDKIYFAQVDIRNVIGNLLKSGTTIAEVKTVTKNNKISQAQQLTTALLNQNFDKVGTEFIVGGIKVIVGERGNVVMSLEDYNKSRDIINLHYFNSKTGKWSWSDVYEEYPDGIKRKKQSEYITNTNSDVIYEVEEGDDLALFVDMTTEWNQKLIDEYYQEDELSEELKDKIQKTLEITSQKNKENNSTLKASGNDITDDNFMLIRKRFADKFVDLLETEGIATLPKKINLDIEVPIKEMFLGTPDFNLDSNNNPIDFNITERGLEEVISQGYVQGKDIILANKKIDVEKISRLFVSNIAKINPEAKIPVVLLRKGKHQFVFPITLTKTEENQSVKLDNILNSAENFIELRKDVNNLMISLGLNTRLTADSDIQLETIRQELENYTTYRTADEIASVEYDKNNLISDATIKIDLEDTLISSPKITVDYSKAILGTKEENEIGAIELRKEIVKDIVEIRKIVNSSPEIPDHSRFVEAFSENDVQNAGTDIINRKDINFMKKTFFSGDKKIPIQSKDIAVKTIGKEKLLNLRSKLEKLEFYENQVKMKKDIETTKKLSCE